MRRDIRLPDGRTLEAWIDPDESGVPLVFHDGTPSGGMPFSAHVSAARQRNLRWISWSRPGYGRSTRFEGRTISDVAADTSDVLDQLAAGSYYVVGWSGGGPHALACGAFMPERVLGVATMAGAVPYPAEGLDYLASMGAENVEELRASLEGIDAQAKFVEKLWPAFRDMTPASAADAFGDLIDEVDRAALTGEFAKSLAANMNDALRDGYTGWLDDEHAIVQPWGFGLDRYEVPVHVWQGGHDRMVPFAHGEWLAAHVGRACPHLLPEKGHLSLGTDCFDAILDEMLGTR